MGPSGYGGVGVVRISTKKRFLFNYIIREVGLFVGLIGKPVSKLLSVA